MSSHPTPPAGGWGTTIATSQWRFAWQRVDGARRSGGLHHVEGFVGGSGSHAFYLLDDESDGPSLAAPHPRIAASIENGDPVISTKWPNRGPYQGIDALLFRPLADAFGRKRMLFERTLATVRRRRLQVCSMGPFSSGHYPYASQRTFGGRGGSTT